MDVSSTDYPRLSHLMTDVDARTANTIVGQLTEYFSGDIDRSSKTPKFLVVYASKSYSNIELEDLSGISVFTLEGNKLSHKFYKIFGREANEDKRLSVTTDYFDISAIDLVSDVAFGKHDTKWTMFKVPYSKTELNGVIKAENLLSKSPREDALSGLLVDYTTMLYSVADGCGSCGGSFGGCENGTCNGSADPDVGCSSVAIANAVSNGSARVSSNADIRLSKAYAFRDGFLAKSVKGRLYTDYYYKISRLGALKKAINLNTIQDHADFAIEVHKVANLLQNGANLDIPITASFHKKASEMINYYKSLSKNLEYIRILNQIQSDLNQYKGKSRNEILSTIK